VRVTVPLEEGTAGGLINSKWGTNTLNPETFVDTERYSLRPFTDSDYEAAARVNREVEPEFYRTAEENRHWAEVLTAEPGRICHRIVAEERRSGDVVALGGLEHAVFGYHPQKYWLVVTVSPAHRGHGIATEMYSILEREALARNAICLWSGAREDHPEGVRFLERHGFSIQRKSWESRLDLTRTDLAGIPDRSALLRDRGIRFTTFSEEGATDPAVRQRLYRLQTIASADVPRMGEYRPISFEQFVSVDLEDPQTVLDGLFLAAHGDDYVGMTTLYRDGSRPESLRIGLTGTHPAFRRWGIASELKRRSVEYARGHGFRYLATMNDSRNQAIWAINQKLGFVRAAAWVEGEKWLTATPVSGSSNPPSLGSSGTDV
jgi:GNAT superfamily N-acetyltransferase